MRAWVPSPALEKREKTVIVPMKEVCVDSLERGIRDGFTRELNLQMSPGGGVGVHQVAKGRESLPDRGPA